MLPDCDKSGARPMMLWPFGIKLEARFLRPASITATKDLNIEVADFFPQGVAVDPEQIGSANLVSARCRQRHRQQRMLDFPQDAVIEPGRRQFLPETSEIGREMALDGSREPLLCPRLVVT